MGAEAGEDPSRTRGRPPSSRPPQDVNPPDGGEGGAVGDEGWEGSRLGLAARPHGDEVIDRHGDGAAVGWPAGRFSNPSHVAARGLPRMGPGGTEMGRRRRCGGFVDCVSGGEFREEEVAAASKFGSLPVT